jgi:hypothetical protein
MRDGARGRSVCARSTSAPTSAWRRAGRCGARSRSSHRNSTRGAPGRARPLRRAPRSLRMRRPRRSHPAAGVGRDGFPLSLKRRAASRRCCVRWCGMSTARSPRPSATGTASRSTGAIALRGGVRELVDERAAAGLPMAIATTTSEANVAALLQRRLGVEWRRRFAAVVGAESAPRKKPDLLAYRIACTALGLPGSACLAIEDARNGVDAARAAGLWVLVTRSAYFAREDVGDRHGRVRRPGARHRTGLAPCARHDARGRPHRAGSDRAVAFGFHHHRAMNRTPGTGRRGVALPPRAATEDIRAAQAFSRRGGPPLVDSAHIRMP